ncbi:MAG: isochorismatase family protein [Planctomycetaceae bacterium]
MPEPDPTLPRSIELASRHDSRLLIIDVQEKLLPHIQRGPRIVTNCHKLIEGAQAVGVPAFATEQYPKGLAPTVAELRDLLGDVPQKLRFSGADVLGWTTAGESDDDRDRIIVAGIEAHVCVLQTACDLMARGFRVQIVADAVGSRRRIDRRIALERLATAGATVTTTEAVLFEWCEAAGTEEFQRIRQIVLERD